MRRGPNFTLRDRGVNACLAKCLNNVLNVKAVVAAFNQEKALVGAFSVIVQLHRLTDLRHYFIPSYLSTDTRPGTATLFIWVYYQILEYWRDRGGGELKYNTNLKYPQFAIFFLCLVLV